MGSSENFLQLIKTQVIRYGGLGSRSGMVGLMLGLLIRGLLFFGEFVLTHVQRAKQRGGAPSARIFFRRI